MSDPFLNRLPPLQASIRVDTNADEPNTHLNLITREFEAGRFESGWGLLAGCVVNNPRHRLELAWLRAALATRRGFPNEAMNFFIADQTHYEDFFHWLHGATGIGRFSGLVPDDTAMQRWVTEADAHLQTRTDRPPRADFVFCFQEYKAFWWSRRAAVGPETEDFLEKSHQLYFVLCNSANASRPVGECSAAPRIRARALAGWADVLRMRGDIDRARHCLDEARTIQIEKGFEGESAEFTLVNQAKLMGATSEALECLQQARRILVGTANQIGLARVELCQARLFPRPEAESTKLREILTRLPTHIPALRTCILYNRILDHWSTWISGGKLSPEQDMFWGL